MKTRTVVWQGWPHAPAPIEALSRVVRLRVANDDGTLEPVTSQVVDEAHRPLHLGLGGQLWELARIVWQRVTTLALALLANVTAGKRPRPAPTTGPTDGPVVLVLPVLPDLSHTFVYREVLALLRLRPDWRVLVLQHNPTAPVHPEARELTAKATFLPREGITRSAVRVLRWLATRRGRDLFALYRAEPGGAAADLLGKLALRHPNHPGNAFLLADTIRTLKPRHLHVYGSTWPTNVAMGAARLLGVPFSISSYVDFEFDYSHKMLATKFRDARFFRVVTAYCKARLRTQLPTAKAEPERVPVVYLGLDLSAWSARHVPSSAAVLVSAARLVPKKGLHLVPPALAALRARGVACRWRIAGNGPEETRLRRLCIDHGVDDLVDFLGPLDNAAVQRELLAATLAVLPCVVATDGERDGIPIFLVEAMALGVPIVTTSVSGIPELVRDRDTGFVAVPGDAASLAEALATALGDASLARAVGDRGRAEVHAKLDVDVMARQLAAEIER
ncbi:MAG: glycosyltransferase family 4 protein [Planctomycetes bacterium]|nr:glycosyltransferase family 4 protein [Planctomycetota bacterium]